MKIVKTIFWTNANYLYDFNTGTPSWERTNGRLIKVAEIFRFTVINSQKLDPKVRSL